MILGMARKEIYMIFRQKGAIRGRTPSLGNAGLLRVKDGKAKHHHRTTPPLSALVARTDVTFLRQNVFV